VSPDGYAHSAALAEIMETVAYALRGLGCTVSQAANRLLVPGPVPIVLGAHLLSSHEIQLLPTSTIVYNLEQIEASSSWCSSGYLDLLKRGNVWDYSRRNIATLGKLGGAGQVKHVPIGYVPEMTRVTESPVEDIDVLFYGSMNERRSKVIDELRRAGLVVAAVFGVYGRQRDDLISRSKVVLNLHYYETSIFELVRVSYLLANRKAVVAECHPGTELEPGVEFAVRLTHYEDLVQACIELAGDLDGRRQLAEKGFSWMTARDERHYLGAALGIRQQQI
jgi:hypothetical protein